ncbi:MAG: hypothetical protein LBU94_02255 [Clostridiales bacterium]|nr:hypothetical protein [Clostridiales bacterium]
MNQLQKYFAYRQNLIDQYTKGDMSKAEYLEKNFDAVLSLRQEPFKYLDNIDKCLFNYQYYNALAKEAKMSSTRQEEYDLKNDELRQVNYYYSKKDSATLKALELLDFKGVSAYFIKVRSKYLSGKLFEIVFDDNNMVLHSMNEAIHTRLLMEGIFEQGVKVSKTDMYINQRY